MAAETRDPGAASANGNRREVRVGGRDLAIDRRTVSGIALAMVAQVTVLVYRKAMRDSSVREYGDRQALAVAEQGCSGDCACAETVAEAVEGGVEVGGVGEKDVRAGRRAGGGEADGVAGDCGRGSGMRRRGAGCGVAREGISRGRGGTGVEGEG